jgi:hypothetical protein
MEGEWSGYGGLFHHETRDAGTLRTISQLVALREIRGYRETHFTHVSEESAASMFRLVKSAQVHRPGSSSSYICITFSEAQLNFIS